MTLLVFLAAFFLAISGFLFDSYWVKVVSIPYPLIFLLLGVLIAGILLLVMRKSEKQSEPLLCVFFLFLIFMIISTASSFFSGAGDILALGMKSSTIVVNFLFFCSGYLLVNDKKGFFFAKSFFWLSLVLSASFSLFLTEMFNPNWLGITLVFSVLILMLLEKRRKLIVFSLFFFGVSVFSYLILSSRGAAISAFLAAVYLAFVRLNFRRLEYAINCFTIIFLIFSTVFVSVFGVWLYNSKFYPYLVTLSIENTGKSLDSSRLERWNLGAQLFLDRPVFGWGIDSHIARASDSDSYGDLHNFWWEVIFRGGLVGALCFMLIFSYIAYKVIKNNAGAEEVAAFLILFTFMSVYALGGVTHWPGAYMFWLTLGVVLGRSLSMRTTSRASDESTLTRIYGITDRFKGH